MPKRYSPEIRRTALELVNQGQTCQATARLRTKRGIFEPPE